MDEDGVAGESAFCIRLLTNHLHGFKDIHLSGDACPCILKVSKAVLEQPENLELIFLVLGPKSIDGPACQCDVRDLHLLVDTERPTGVNVGVPQDAALHAYKTNIISRKPRYSLHLTVDL